MTLKLLAISKNISGKIEARVHPAFVSNSHPLATVSGSFNAVHLIGDNVGDIMLYGRGAGDLPTGSAIVSDIIYAAAQTKHKYSPFNNNGSPTRDSDFVSDFTSKYYIRLNVMDKCGILGKIATVFGKYNVSIKTMLQKSGGDEGVPIIFVTHETSEKNIQKALELVKGLDGVQSIDALIRVES
jgi:homoserine dehydrogenase